MDIYDYISGEKESPTTRAELRERTGIGDRDNRLLITKARTSKKVNPRGVILSTSRKPGYWISDDIHDIDRFIRELKSRVKILIKIIMHCERYKILKKSMDKADLQ